MDQEFLKPLSMEGYKCGFVGRVEGVEVDTDRDATIARLEPFHREAVGNLGFEWSNFWRAEQVHGAEVAVVDSKEGALIGGVDGLVTNVRGVAVGIYVADCGAIYLLDKKHNAIGLLHSGKKGTELEILGEALRKMKEVYGTDPGDVIGVLAPCIRPPAYDVDFACQIRMNAERLGIVEFHDCGICTSSDLGRYYSYRVERGATGRMLAIFGIEA
ncbi:laccase domain-containing protein [Rubritalea spongiae]|uniref:Laccase domain-containing protein n=1 Tax=Rubritalea spongiae TaxID=430797 RepID=A0ABW5E4V9_9BACT